MLFFIWYICIIRVKIFRDFYSRVSQKLHNVCKILLRFQEDRNLSKVEAYNKFSEKFFLKEIFILATQIYPKSQTISKS